MNWITVTEKHQNSLFAKHLSSIEDLLSLSHVVISKDPLCRLLRIECEGKYYYCKLYRRSGKHLRRFLGLSRAKREWVNLRYLQELGIPTPNVVAYGERRKLQSYQGILITEDVKNSIDLATIAEHHHSLFKQKHWLETLTQLMAQYVRLIHRKQFIYNDLKWRNILVKPTEAPSPYFIDCPCGGKKRGWLYHRGIIKDLACLDKKAKVYLTKTQRLAFYLQYYEIEKVTQAHKRQIRKILNFFKGRE